MTEQERISRDALLKRAAATAGVVYSAPVLTSSAGAEADRLRTCRPGRSCETGHDCRNRGREPCVCCPEGTEKAFTCQRTRAACGRGGGICSADAECTNRIPCDVLRPCRDYCVCYVLSPQGVEPAAKCVRYSSAFCADFPPCDRKTGAGCPPGHCCLDTCCPTGICETPCSRGSAPRIARSAGSGPKTTLPG